MSGFRHLKLIASRVSLDVALQNVDPALPEKTAPGSICTWISLDALGTFARDYFEANLLPQNSQLNWCPFVSFLL